MKQYFKSQLFYISDANRIWQRLAALQIRLSETEDLLNSFIQVLEEH